MRAVCSVVLVASLLASPIAANATTMQRATLPELAQDAALIAVVEVGASTSFWDSGRIRTRHELLVRDTWKGPRLERVSVLTLGGVVGDLGQRVEGEAALPTGRRLVVFLEALPERGAYRVLSMHQGAFLIEELQSSPPAKVKGMDPAQPLLPSTGLSDFKRRVQELLLAR
jgi:hypothetical protein